MPVLINPYFGTEETILAAEIDVAELRSVEKTIPAASSVPVSEALSFSASASGGQVPKSPTDTFKEMLEHHLWPEFKEFVRQSIRGQCRQVLAYHTTTACRPGKKEGVQGSLIDCGLEAAVEVSKGRWKFRMTMPNLVTSDDARSWVYEASYQTYRKYGFLKQSVSKTNRACATQHPDTALKTIRRFHCFELKWFRVFKNMYLFRGEVP